MKRLLHSTVKTTLQLALTSMPRAACNRFVPRKVFGLCYHLVSDQVPTHVTHVCPFKNTAAFHADMTWLKDHFEILDYEEACRRKVGSASSRRPAVVVTFDDGYRECITTVAPILQELAIPAVFFITTRFIDNHELFYRNKASLCIDALETLQHGTQVNVLQQMTQLAGSATFDPHCARKWLLGLGSRDQDLLDATCQILAVDTAKFLETEQPYMTSDEIRSLNDSGFTIGAHGTGHTHLASLCPDQIESELAGSCGTIADLTDTSVVPFAFPFSGHRVDRAALHQVRTRHPHIGLLFDSRGILPDEPTVIHRISADHPPDSSQTQSTNLPMLVQEAYAHELRQQWIAPLKSLLKNRQTPPG